MQGVLSLFFEAAAMVFPFQHLFLGTPRAPLLLLSYFEHFLLTCGFPAFDLLFDFAEQGA